MKKAIISIITAVAKLLLLSLICNFVYSTNELNKVFGPNISYSQWVAIIVIINSIVPNGITNSSLKNDNERS
jgi:hypothetical protein